MGKLQNRSDNLEMIKIIFPLTLFVSYEINSDTYGNFTKWLIEEYNRWMNLAEYSITVVFITCFLIIVLEI